ncbi:MAG: hypothetical protein AAGC67_12125 [Myxococcota bacterium]
MPFIDYAPEETLRDARARYFASCGLGDGGYDDEWVVFRARGVPYAAFPNTPERVRSVRLHDIHHVVAGYDTSWVGEGEIAAWELASGCKDHYAAWVLNGLAFLIGLVIAPGKTREAWRRGRATKNLYDGEWDEAILDRSVGEVRLQLDLA